MPTRFPFVARSRLPIPSHFWPISAGGRTYNAAAGVESGPPGWIISIGRDGFHPVRVVQAVA